MKRYAAMLPWLWLALAFATARARHSPRPSQQPLAVGALGGPVAPGERH